MTNRERAYEVGHYPNSDGAHGEVIGCIKRLILGAFEIPQGGGDLTEPGTPEELYGVVHMHVTGLCREALNELVNDGKVIKTNQICQANGAPFYQRKAPK